MSYKMEYEDFLTPRHSRCHHNSRTKRLIKLRKTPFGGNEFATPEAAQTSRKLYHNRVQTIRNRRYYWCYIITDVNGTNQIFNILKSPARLLTIWKISKALANHSKLVFPKCSFVHCINKLVHDDFLLFRINFTNIKATTSKFCETPEASPTPKRCFTIRDGLERNS